MSVGGYLQVLRSHSQYLLSYWDPIASRRDHFPDSGSSLSTTWIIKNMHSSLWPRWARYYHWRAREVSPFHSPVRSSRTDIHLRYWARRTVCMCISFIYTRLLYCFWSRCAQLFRHWICVLRKMDRYININCYHLPYRVRIFTFRVGRADGSPFLVSMSPSESEHSD